ncbi:von Willebrand factor A domain-containing protein 7 [Collichthys lucidus]|uniref:von Willebrand factor A domain-containing protein 7 n=1 Tax=Collichthys lucidus TaxID=240159 RepID=A0A4U5U4V3_COLLU|nr:von Willebrand factor A domain-containing protein 7 [Collichthys lucidus]
MDKKAGLAGRKAVESCRWCVAEVAGLAEFLEEKQTKYGQYRLIMTLLLGIALLALALSGPTVAFVPIGGGASTHISITATALLQKVTETCRAVAEAAGHEFEPTGPSPEELVQACLGPTATGEVSGAKFHSALQEIYTQNGLIDRDFVNSAPHHFNSEAFLEGRGLITEGVVAIKANIGKENFKAARKTLGRVLHTLQDFYSHSNWVELGYTEPYTNLLHPDLPLENLADVNTATCSDCASGTCPNPILPSILKEKKLTSGYMGTFSANKPKALLALALSGPTVAFVPIGGGASTHISITGAALLQKVTETCRAVAEAAGHEFEPTGPSPEELVQACLGPTATGEVSGAKFHSALQEIYTQNGLIDRDFVNSAPHHFNSEAFLEGRGLITEGVVAIKANIGKENFKAARETLGRVLHTLQDFYSHSNWVELGYTEPYTNLLRPDLPLENLADVNTATCSDCASGTCPNPILPSILKEKKLTSGYMGIFSANKPKGIKISNAVTES